MPAHFTRCFSLALIIAWGTSLITVAAQEAESIWAFEGEIGPTLEDSVPDWPELASAPDGAPNILVILLDDIGFADAHPFGGLAETPAFERAVSQGVVFNNFNVTAMCSPVRFQTVETL
jgi:arylsulfatase